MFGSTQTQCVVGRIVGPEFYGGMEDSRVDNLSSCQEITLNNFYSVGGKKKFPHERDHERKRRYFQKG